MHVWLLDAEAAATAAARGSSGGRMLGQQQQQQQLYSSAAILTGERSRLLTCYVQDYLECVESLPHDMQRNVSVLRELDFVLWVDIAFAVNLLAMETQIQSPNAVCWGAFFRIRKKSSVYLT